MLLICDLIRDNRKNKKMTIKEVALATNISMVSLIKYETNKLLPKPENLYKLSQVLEFDYDEAYDMLSKEKKSRKL